MYANKSVKTKSKRAQLSAKKKQKNNSLTPRIVDLDSEINLISSEESSFDNHIEVVETRLPKNNNNPMETSLKNMQTAPLNKFNSFNYQRLTKTIPSLIQVNPQFRKPKLAQIQIVEDDKPLNSNTEQAYKSYTFSLQGQKDSVKIRDAFLSDVASKQINNVPKKTSIDQAEKPLVSEQVVQKQAQKNSRYFQFSHEICFKCNQEGHYARNCINEDMRKCKICFSRLHDEHSCPQTCYECGETGHISSECPYSKNQRCERCRHRGHTTSYCGVILRDKQRINNIESYFTESDLKKMKCINEQQHETSAKKGPHFNCFAYKDWPMPYHQLRKPHSQSMHSHHFSKHNNEQRPSYKVHQQGFLYKNNAHQYRQDRRDNRFNNYGHEEQRFHSKNDNRRWKNDEFQHFSRSLDEHKKGGRGKWEKKGRNNRDLYY